MNKTKMHLRQAPVFILTLTPELAKEFLENNFEDNRSVRSPKVKEYVSHIKEGRWNPLDGDLLRRTKDGVLIDGQHRCQAVIESGKACDVLYCEEFENSDFSKIDAGTSRKPADGLAGESDKNNRAALIGFLMRSGCLKIPLTTMFSRGGGGGGIRHVSNNEVSIFNDKHSQILSEALGHGRAAKTANDRGGVALYSWFWCATQGSNKEMSDRFFAELEKELVSFTMFSVFRKRLYKMVVANGSVGNRSLFAGDVLALLAPMWNAFLQNRDLARIEGDSDFRIKGYNQGDELKVFGLDG